MARHFVLLDANVQAAHFAPITTSNKTLLARSRTLLSGTSTVMDPHFLTPTFCIAEVFAVFEKYRWGSTWNPQVSKSLSAQKFTSTRQSFQNAIHNGSKILQVELNRYHVLCIDLISPINHAYKIKRNKPPKTRPAKPKKPRTIHPASTYDMLLVAMGIWLSHQYGRDNFTVVTGDERIFRVVERARSVKLAKPMKNHLQSIARSLGLTYGPDMYPHVVDLAHVSKADLAVRFPAWTPSW